MYRFRCVRARTPPLRSRGNIHAHTHMHEHSRVEISWVFQSHSIFRLEFVWRSTHIPGVRRYFLPSEFTPRNLCWANKRVQIINNHRQNECKHTHTQLMLIVNCRQHTNTSATTLFIGVCVYFCWHMSHNRSANHRARTKQICTTTKNNLSETESKYKHHTRRKTIPIRVDGSFHARAHKYWSGNVCARKTRKRSASVHVSSCLLRY